MGQASEFLMTERMGKRIAEAIESLDFDTKDYNAMINKPEINGIVLQGHLQPEQLGLYAKPNGGIPSTDLTNDVRASLTKADNAASATQLQAVQATADEALQIAKESSKAKVFSSQEAMEAWIRDPDNAGKMDVGDDMYIVALSVPDYWIAEVLETPDAEGRYYVLQELETAKVNLVDYLKKTGDAKDNTVTFTSDDVIDPDEKAEIALVQSGENLASLFRKFSRTVKTVRWILGKLGDVDISAIGGGTLTGAIAALNTDALFRHRVAAYANTGGNVNIKVPAIQDSYNYKAFFFAVFYPYSDRGAKIGIVNSYANGDNMGIHYIYDSVTGFVVSAYYNDDATELTIKATNNGGNNLIAITCFQL